MKSMRIDKWLWAVRLFKTRSLATASCKAGVVKIGDRRAKPANVVNPGDTVYVTKEGVHRTLIVVALLEKRVGAKLVPEYMEDKTPQSEWALVRDNRNLGKREQGSGRPTKRDRREMDRFFG